MPDYLPKTAQMRHKENRSSCVLDWLNENKGDQPFSKVRDGAVTVYRDRHTVGDSVPISDLRLDFALHIQNMVRDGVLTRGPRPKCIVRAKK